MRDEAFVLPGFRRRGVGRALVAGIVLRATEMGFARMRLDTPEDNDPALSLYRSYGFGPIESYHDPDHGHVHENWAWLGAALPADPKARRAVKLAMLEATYLADDDPRAGSGFTGDEARWEAKRRVITKALHRDGTFLDMCCANGYLMESVERWARAEGLKIETHGLDVSARLVEEARRRLPDWADRIHVGDAVRWDPPRTYDFVYTLTGLVGDDDGGAFYRRLLTDVVAPGGRLVLGMYTLADAELELVRMRSWGLEPAGVAQGPVLDDSPSLATTVAWFDGRPSQRP